MAPSLADVIGRFKADLGRFLSADAIEQTCRDLKHAYRRRCLDPVTTVHTFLTQILHGNTACSALPHLTGKDFSAAAYVKARSRLPLALFEGLFERTAQGLAATRATTERWHVHRLWLVDGSSFPMPDRPELQAAFGQPCNQEPGSGCNSPVIYPGPCEPVIAHETFGPIDEFVCG